METLMMESEVLKDEEGNPGKLSKLKTLSAIRHALRNIGSS